MIDGTAARFWMLTSTARASLLSLVEYSSRKSAAPTPIGTMNRTTKAMIQIVPMIAPLRPASSGSEELLFVQQVRVEPRCALDQGVDDQPGEPGEGDRDREEQDRGEDRVADDVLARLVAEHSRR